MIHLEMATSSSPLETASTPADGDRRELRVAGIDGTELVITPVALEIRTGTDSTGWPLLDIQSVYQRTPAWSVSVYERIKGRRRLVGRTFTPLADDARTLAAVRAALPKRVRVRRLGRKREALELSVGFVLLLAVVGAAGLVVVNLWPKGGSPAAPAVSWPSIVADVQSQYADVLSGEYADGLLVIRVGGDWTDLGATRLACETVKPILASHGVGGQQFAIYDRHGSVIATGSRC